MPARNVVKSYRADTCYHAYNRGVEKRVIFADDLDYRVFLSCLKLYLSPPQQIVLEPAIKQKLDAYKLKPAIEPHLSLHNEVELLSFCLMPNHFHLQLKQKTIDGMKKLLQRVCTRYAIYFNRRHERVGGLYQGTYKAVSLDLPLDILYISYYIHLNPWLKRDSETKRLHLEKGVTFNQPYSYSSLPYYLGQKQTVWVKPQTVLDQLSQVLPPYRSYQEFLSKSITDLEEVLTNKVLEV